MLFISSIYFDYNTVPAFQVFIYFLTSFGFARIAPYYNNNKTKAHGERTAQKEKVMDLGTDGFRRKYAGGFENR